MNNGLVDTIKNLAKQKKRKLAAPLAGYPGAILTGTAVLANLKDDHVQSETLLELHKAYGFDILFPFMDLSVEAEALGLAIEFHGDGSPDVREHPVASVEDLQRFTVPEPSRAGRMGTFVKTIRRVKDSIDELDKAPLVAGYVASPFTLAGLLMGAENLAINTLLKPEFCDAVINFATKCIIPYAKALQDAGADMIMLLDPTAVLLSPKLYDSFARPSIEQVATALNVPTILHVCGQTTPLMSNLAATKIAGLSLDSDVDIPSIMHLIPDEMVVLGNINPVSVFLNGEANTVNQETKKLMEHMMHHDNFVMSSGCDLPTETPLENLESFAKAVGTLR
jgi:uroporphyrinogen decarboxylase